MMRAPWVAASVLVALAVGLWLAPGAAAHPQYPQPTVDNYTGPGLAGLYTWLSEAGSPVATLRAGDALPVDGGSLLVAGAGPTELTTAQVERLGDWVKNGGRLIYLLPQKAGQNRALERWLQLERAPGDGTGQALSLRAPVGLWAGVGRLETSAGQPRVRLGLAGAIDIAEPSGHVWYAPHGRGEALILPGTFLASNAGLLRADHAQLWLNLASAGPLVFDERPHAHPVRIGWPPAAWAVLGQLILLGLVWVASRAPRLGTPLPPEAFRTPEDGTLAVFLDRAGIERDLLAMRPDGPFLQKQDTAKPAPPNDGMLVEVYRRTLEPGAGPRRA